LTARLAVRLAALGVRPFDRNFLPYAITCLIAAGNDWSDFGSGPLDPARGVCLDCLVVSVVAISAPRRTGNEEDDRPCIYGGGLRSARRLRATADAGSALPPGPTPDEVADYTRAQAQYRSGLPAREISTATTVAGVLSSELRAGAGVEHTRGAVKRTLEGLPIDQADAA
jgi:hypothetical protein